MDNGNATNAETNDSQNRCGILFPIDGEISAEEEYLISLIKTSGKEKDYELIEYITDVNRPYAEVLMEQNCNGAMDTAYVYGTGRLSLDRFDGSTGYYLYDPKGSVAGITNGEGQICRSYRYGAFGEITYGAPQYENVYAYNGESYNPNVGSLYLRARYYNMATGAFFTEDSYLGDIREPLTLNRYVYCVGNPVNYVDPSGKSVENDIMKAVMSDSSIPAGEKGSAIDRRIRHYLALWKLNDSNATFDYVMQFDYSNSKYLEELESRAVLYSAYTYCSDNVGADFKRYYEKYGYVSSDEYLISEKTLTDIGWQADMSEVRMYTINMMLIEFEINTPERLKHFFTQVLMESGNGIYLREGEQLLNREDYTQEKYEEYYNNRYQNGEAGYAYIDRGVGYIQSTFTYNQQSFAVYLFLLDYPNANIHPVPSAHFDREQIAIEYERMLQYAMENGIDSSEYSNIVTLGTDYIAENYPWDVTGYWWISHDMNKLIDELVPGNAQEVDRVTDKVNYNLGRDKRDLRIEKYEDIAPFIQ